MPRNITGEVFGDLTVLRPHTDRYCGSPGWVCLCVCGTEKITSFNKLTTGNVKSCGCRKSRSTSQKNFDNTRHGHASGDNQSRTYKSWCSMFRRCRNPAAEQYPDYGGRGITVCERWNDFVTFLEDMGERPEDTTLERLDVNGPYSPENCVWATIQQQSRNRRNTVRLTLNGVTKCLSEWADECGINRNTLRRRLANGWSVEDAIRLKPLPRGRRYSGRKNESDTDRVT